MRGMPLIGFFGLQGQWVCNTRDIIRLLQTIALNPVFDDLKPLSLDKIKIGWMGNLDNYLAMEAGIIELCEASLADVAGVGARVESMQPNFTISDLWDSWTTLSPLRTNEYAGIL